jgi:hypothetical protein
MNLRHMLNFYETLSEEDKEIYLETEQMALYYGGKTENHAKWNSIYEKLIKFKEEKANNK